MDLLFNYNTNVYNEEKFRIKTGHWVQSIMKKSNIDDCVCQ